MVFVGGAFGTAAIAPVSLLSIQFEGPFHWLQDGHVSDLATAPCASSPGLYLWTVPLSGGYLVYYVGETGRSFGSRFSEHAEHWLAGRYEICEPTDFARGVRRPIWPGAYGRDRKAPTDCAEAARSHSSVLRELTHQVRIFLGPIDCDRRLRCRIEAGLARHLRAQPGIIGGFQSPEVRYTRRRIGEVPVECAFRSESRVLGLPATLEV